MIYIYIFINTNINYFKILFSSIDLPFYVELLQARIGEPAIVVRDKKGIFCAK